jgi:glucose/arabinose dehydrogenase
MRRRFHLIFAVLAMSTVAACDGGPASPAPGSGDAGTITGKERIGWDQQAANASDLAAIRFALYIDGNRVELTGASCVPPATSTGFPCSSPLPSMTAGKHTLELASFVVGATILESARSSSISVTVASSLTTSALSTGGSADPVKDPDHGRPDLKTADGLALRVDLMAGGVNAPTSIGVVPDGRIFVAERGGQVRTIRDGQLEPAAALSVTDAFVAGDGGGILSLALDPGFETTRFVYLLDVTTGDNGPSFRLSRFREVGGVLGERAVLLDRVPAAPDRPTGSIAFGPDGKLYVALDDGGERDRAAQPGSFNGKVLRLNSDGTTPDDQPAGTPVYSIDHPSPSDLDWDPASLSLWLADTRRHETDCLIAVRSPSGRRVEREPFTFPITSGPSSLAMIRTSAVAALQRNLFVASGDDGNVLRVRFSDASPTVLSTERLTIDRTSRVRVLEAAADGSLYVGLEREILRVSPR